MCNALQVWWSDKYPLCSLLNENVVESKTYRSEFFFFFSSSCPCLIHELYMKTDTRGQDAQHYLVSYGLSVLSFVRLTTDSDYKFI